MATALLGATAGAAAQTLWLVDNPSLGSFVDLTKFDPQTLALGADGEVEVGTFSGNLVCLPGLVVVGQNGGLAFGQLTVTDLAAENEPIPSSNAFLGGQAALAYWDDIDDKDGDTLLADVVGDPDLGDRLIVQWSDNNFDGAGSTLLIQAHVLSTFDATGIYAQYMYRIEGPAADAGESATIGYQDGGTGYGDVQFSFNTPGAVTDGTVLSLIIPEPADIDTNGTVDIDDFLALLGSWGPCEPCEGCRADIDGDCVVGISDFLLLLGNWS